MWYAMIHCCLPDILWGILPCHYLILLHIIWPLSICCQHHLISISSFTNNKPLCGPFFHSCYILWWIKVFCWYFLFPYSHFPKILTLCGHNCHTSCMCPWRPCSCVFYILHILAIEISFLGIVSLVYGFCPIMSSRTRKIISWGTCMLSSRCWYYKIL